MILEKYDLNQRMAVNIQKREIERIKNAELGTVLYAVSTCINADIISTLFYLAGAKYRVGVYGSIAYYVKE